MLNDLNIWMKRLNFTLIDALAVIEWHFETTTPEISLQKYAELWALVSELKGDRYSIYPTH